MKIIKLDTKKKADTTPHDLHFSYLKKLIISWPDSRNV